MQAVTVVPGTAGSVSLDEVPEPDIALGSVLVEALAVGVCGTDAEIATEGLYIQLAPWAFHVLAWDRVSASAGAARAEDGRQI